MLLAGRDANLNLRAAFLEVVERRARVGRRDRRRAGHRDHRAGTRADAVASLLIGALILPRTLALLRETVDVLLESTPRGLDLDAVREHILSLPHVRGVHDLHASQIATGLPVLTAHVVVEDDCFHDGHLPPMLDAAAGLRRRALRRELEHSTFQLEPLGHGEPRGRRARLSGSTGPGRAPGPRGAGVLRRAFGVAPQSRRTISDSVAPGVFGCSCTTPVRTNPIRS